MPRYLHTETLRGPRSVCMEVVVYHVGIVILWSLPPIGDPVPGCRDHRMPVFKYQHRYDRRLLARYVPYPGVLHHATRRVPILRIGMLWGPPSPITCTVDGGVGCLLLAPSISFYLMYHVGRVPSHPLSLVPKECQHGR